MKHAKGASHTSQSGISSGDLSSGPISSLAGFDPLSSQRHHALSYRFLLFLHVHIAEDSGSNADTCLGALSGSGHCRGVGSARPSIICAQSAAEHQSLVFQLRF